MSDDSRLERIEKKLDEVGQAIVSLARIEERMVTLFKRMDNLDEEQSDHNKRIRTIEDRVGTNGQMLRFGERIFWIITTAVIGYFFTTRM
jgi:predicted  nucleic acid-binding Zn-ribbon protein